MKNLKKSSFLSWNGSPSFWNRLPNFLLKLQKLQGWIPSLPSNLDKNSIHFRFFQRYIGLFSKKKIQTIHSTIVSFPKQSVLPNIHLQKPPPDFEFETLRSYRVQLLHSFKCDQFSLFIKTNHPCEQFHKNLYVVLKDFLTYDIPTESLTECIHLLFYLSFLCHTTQSVPQIMTLYPFRAYYFLLINSNQNDAKLIETIFSNHFIILESEYLNLKNFRILLHFESKTQFSFKKKYRYTEKNEKKLINQIKYGGITVFAMEVFEDWISDHELIQFIRELLQIAFENGTYHIKNLASLLKSSINLYPSLIGVVKAYVIMCENSLISQILKKDPLCKIEDK